MEDPAVKVARLLENSSYAIVFTGAGVSADSGIPTFRGPDGLWRRYRPEELASPWGFERNPRLVWEWYAWRMRIIASARPNAAHYAIAALERRGLVRAVITQNVDGLHQRAGSKNVIELHGNIWRARCTRCGYRWILESPPSDDELPLRCPRCGSLARPDVVWFGEPLPEAALRRAFEEAGKADLVIVVGTSGVVEPAGSIPVHAKERGARLVNVNPEPNRYTGMADVNVEERAAPFFERLARVLGLELPRE
ncbi:MAG: NAD-dependent protein deacetylase [Desulfurococcales archaeon]|nr:NAD-dependent protein deacetylase [Desulfurococcales archaeon]